MKIKRKTIAQIRKGVAIASLCGVLLFLWWGYFRTSVFTITHYRLTGVDASLRNALEESLLQQGSTTPYVFFPPSKVLTFQKKQLTETVLKSIPEAKDITLYPVGAHTVAVDVEKYTPLFRDDHGEGISDTGALFATKEYLSQYPLLFIASTTRRAKSHGTLVRSFIDPVDQSLLHTVSDFSRKVSSVIFPVSSITIDGAGDIFLRNASSTHEVRANKESDLTKVWLTLLSAIDTDPLKTKIQTENDSLLYLDVRFGNKVFYKFATSTKR